MVAPSQEHCTTLETSLDPSQDLAPSTLSIVQKIITNPRYAIYLLCLLPWMLSNQSRFGFFGLSKGMGINLFLRVYELDAISPVLDTRYPHMKETFERLRANHPGKHVYFFLEDALERTMVNVHSTLLFL